MSDMSTANIVVGVDGSEQSIAALRFARRLADSLGHGLEAIAAWSYPASMGEYFPTDWDPASAAEKFLAEAVETAYGADRPDGLTMSVAQGAPAQVLIEASKGAAMIVVGSRGHGGFVGMVLGSVSTAVAAHATCPVVIHHGEE